ncbi:MAG: helix-turn-helix transcriptional regulator [Mycetocola sp.]
MIALSEEPVHRAFERLRSELRPLVRFGGVDVEFVEPPVNGRALPGEVAHAARAVVRGTILLLNDQEDLSRIRIQWDCDGDNLLITIRDDGPGHAETLESQLPPIEQRVSALDGEMNAVSTAGWGTELTVRIPLDPPKPVDNSDDRWGLVGREWEVLRELAAGKRNRQIAADLGISENTVKFHLGKVFRKLGVHSRAEAIATAQSAF